MQVNLAIAFSTGCFTGNDFRQLRLIASIGGRIFQLGAAVVGPAEVNLIVLTLARGSAAQDVLRP